MAVFPPYLVGLMELRVEQTLPNGAAAVSVLYANSFSVATPTDVELDAFATAARTFYQELATQSLSTGWTLDQTIALDRSQAVGAVRYDATQIVGTIVEDPLPQQTQMCVTWRTANAGRRYRGRTFLAGFTEDSSTATGDIDPLTVTVVQGAAEQFLADLAGDDIELVVLSRGNTSPPAPAAWAAFFTRVETVAVNNKWDVLRSRRR